MASGAVAMNRSIDVSSWTAAAANLTRYAPSAKDLLLAGPRAGMRIGSYFLALPDTIDGVLGMGGRFGQRVVPAATNLGGTDAVTTTTALAAEAVQAAAAQAGADTLVHEAAGAGMASRFSIESARSFGNIFSYSTSRWAMACIGMAILLNRTHIYASPRRNLTFGWKMRFTLRILPIILFASQAQTLLRSIHCQTSPDFSSIRWGNASKTSELMFNQNGGALHSISSVILFGETDETSCIAAGMVSPEEEPLDGLPELRGSLSRLWPLFETLCFSQFIETLSCALQGRQISAETGMTLFEHSLAFAEAEAAVSSSLGWGPFGEKRSAGTPLESRLSELSISRSMILERVNTPAEVLLVGFLSSMNHLTSHVLGIFNLQGRLRLLSTALWGVSFMAAITLSIYNFSFEDTSNQALLRFPTVCIIGFIPHVLVFAGILVCGIIYNVALLITAFAPPNGGRPQPVTMMGKLRAAHANMQANVTLSNIRISMHMDFYQALLKTGYNVLTMASEAVYLNESPEVNIKQRTWLEEDRLKEMEEEGALWLGPNFRAPQREMPDEVGLVVTKDENAPLKRLSTSGYSRERIARKGKVASKDRAIRDGVGATERSGRWVMAIEFFFGIGRLISSVCASGAIKALALIGIERRPQWLNWLARDPKSATKATQKETAQSEDLEFWLVDDEGVLRLPVGDHVDIEVEMRKRLRTDEKLSQGANIEETLDANLYGWWLHGGWWGGDDGSGLFEPFDQDDDDDATSVITSASQVSEADWESEDEGRRTPTQASPQLSRESSPMLDTPLSNTDLARLLHPRSPEERAQAHALAAHLTNDTIVTRSRFRTLNQREKTKVLTSTRQLPSNMQRLPGATKLTDEEEIELLEHLIKTRREFSSGNASNVGNATWAEGASGMGENGPQCVVCQSQPRSIIVWPCRCLSLCDGCRVSLAMNNFDKCVCCRRDVGSFSRIFVP